LIEISDLRKALGLIIKEKADYSFPIAEYPSSIQRALRMTSSGKLEPFCPQYEKTRTQDLEAAYHDAGQFYWGTREAWLSNDNIHSSGVGILIPSWRVADIDTTSDWERAEIICKNANK
jgi:CMP-N-acetylneuraminic acid synthetase